MRQLFTSSLSMMTEHAPHSPSPHPSLIPVRWRSPRNTSRSRAIGYVSTSRSSPLTLNRMRIFSGIDDFHQIFGNERDVIYAAADRILDCIENSGGRTVERELANTFGSSRTVAVGILFVVHTNRRHIHRSGYHVISYLVVHHTALAIPQDALARCVAYPLSDATFHLSLCANWINHAADVIQSDNVIDVDLM